MTNELRSPTLEQVEAALEGDENSLNSLLERYGVRLRAAVIYAGASRFVDDCVQDALLVITNELRARRFEPRHVGAFRAWAHEIARNVARKRLKSERQNPRHFESVVDGGEQGFASECPDPRGVDPAVTSVYRDELARRRRLISGLRRQDQVLMDLREHSARTFEQVAQDLANLFGVEVSTDAVRKRYARLRDEVGDPIEPY